MQQAGKIQLSSWVEWICHAASAHLKPAQGLGVMVKPSKIWQRWGPWKVKILQSHVVTGPPALQTTLWLHAEIWFSGYL